MKSCGQAVSPARPGRRRSAGSTPISGLPETRPRGRGQSRGAIVGRSVLDRASIPGNISQQSSDFCKHRVRIAHQVGVTTRPCRDCLCGGKAVTGGHQGIDEFRICPVPDHIVPGTTITTDSYDHSRRRRQSLRCKHATHGSNQYQVSHHYPHIANSRAIRPWVLAEDTQDECYCRNDTAISPQKSRIGVHVTALLCRFMNDFRDFRGVPATRGNTTGIFRGWGSPPEPAFRGSSVPAQGLRASPPGADSVTCPQSIRARRKTTIVQIGNNRTSCRAATFLVDAFFRPDQSGSAFHAGQPKHESLTRSPRRVASNSGRIACVSDCELSDCNPSEPIAPFNR